METPDIDVDGLDQALAVGAPLIDVRNPDEYVAAHVRGSQLIPLPEFVERAGEVPADGTVYVICARGGRSAKAVDLLRSKGIDAINVAGGIAAWIDSGRDTTTGSGPD